MQRSHFYTQLSYCYDDITIREAFRKTQEVYRE